MSVRGDAMSDETPNQPVVVVSASEAIQPGRSSGNTGTEAGTGAGKSSSRA